MKKYILVYIFFFINSFAQNPNISIKTLVEKIKRANPDERRILINQLKIELRRVNRENRKRSMMELKRAFQCQKKYKRGFKKFHRRYFRRMKFRSH
jgi:hypothetical protein